MWNGTERNRMEPMQNVPHNAKKCEMGTLSLSNVRSRQVQKIQMY